MKKSHPKTAISLRTFQRGLAALEFSLVALFIMVPVFIGLFHYWEILQTQQIVSRATGDATRQVVKTLQNPQPINGNYPSQEQALQIAATQAQSSIQAALIQQFGDTADVPSRLKVTLTRADAQNLELNVRFARTATQNSGNTPNTQEPDSIASRSLINWH